MGEVLEAALVYLQHGWPVFPVLGKRAAVAWGSLRTQLPTEEQVRAWWGQFPTAGVAVALGRLSGVVRVDAEGPVPWEDFPLPPTLQFSTPSGGSGWLYQHLEGADTHVYWSGDGDHQELRVQSDGAYTVLPPSPGYAWTCDLPINRVPLWVRDRAVAAALDTVERELRPTVRQPDLEELVVAFQFLPDSDDYDLWVRVGQACKYGDDHHGTDVCFKLWDAWSRRSAKYQEGDCERKWATFQRCAGRVRTLATVVAMAEEHSGGAFRRVNRHEPLTDLGFARVLARVGEGRVKHSSERGWFAYDGARWTARDGEKLVQALQHEVLDMRYGAAVRSLTKHLLGDRGAPDFEDKRRRKQRTLGLIRAHECNSRIQGARAQAASVPSLTCDYRSFDRRPYLLNCRNGTLDLLTGELKPHDPKDLLTQLCPTAYDTDARCLRWERFLMEVFAERERLVRYVQLFLGYCLTGDVSEQVLMNLKGDGANGKGTLLRAVSRVLGPDYTGSAPRDLLIQQRQRGHPTEFMTLHCKRLVWASETADGQRWDEALVKDLTGSDPITARYIREDFVTFEPTHKLAIGTNYAPSVTGTDDGIKRRIKLLPFDVRFYSPNDDPPEGAKLQDRELDEALAAEAPGVLRWMVDGCAAWQREGLREPLEVKDATRSYFAENDKLLAFVADKCRAGVGCKERADRMRDAWFAYAGQGAGTARSFQKRMLEAGYKLADGFYEGVSLK